MEVPCGLLRGQREEAIRRGLRRAVFAQSDGEHHQIRLDRRHYRHLLRQPPHLCVGRGRMIVLSVALHDHAALLLGFDDFVRIQFHAAECGRLS